MLVFLTQSLSYFLRLFIYMLLIKQSILVAGLDIYS